ncbi:hypothetical protein [Brevibacterium spongiae]|uniref:Uncharacterized protein n=1 Tax=Brevibacterium spongiae TaxID=2909672 RepID=A0ABY5SQQ3_9MICO|nr:hypothetical protein [Brevibacterium spongiae]UVI36817.1 hypothetical protein L1F31_03920 [Brevibacterium spongiae]
MTAGHSEKSGQRDTTDDSRAQNHSQTLPMITEELAAAHPNAAHTPTEHVTTPVMPPNPIRRDAANAANQSSGPTHDENLAEQTRAMTDGSRAGMTTASTAAATHVEEGTEKAEDEKKSEGRISATQLIAGAGAAATSSVIGGQLGVAGTVVGAGVASIVTALAVTLYGRSLDKGKEKIQEVGSKLAPAVKAKIAKNPTDKATAVDPSLAEDSAFAPPEPAGGNADETAASAQGDDTVDSEAESGRDDKPRTWWQNLRRKRVLYPLTIGVAAFGIGLGGVVMAESFTDADISPGTSQISRSVSGQSTTGEETNTGTSDSGSSGEDSSSGSGSSADGQQNSSDSGSGGQPGQSTSTGETGSQGTDSSQGDPGANTTTDTGTDTGSTTSDGTDASTGSTASDSAGASGSAGDTGGGTDGSSATGGSGSSAGSGGSSGSGTGGSAGGSSGGSAASAQG